MDGYGAAWIVIGWSGVLVWGSEVVMDMGCHMGGHCRLPMWLVLSCSLSSPCHPVVSRLRGNDGPVRNMDLQDWNDATHRFHPHI